MRDVFTTGHVAKICQVTPRTVAKWFDQGLLPGYKIPGSLDRRFRRNDLIEFLKEHGMPLGELENEVKTKILLVGVEANMTKSITAALSADDFEIVAVPDGFSAGMELKSLYPDYVVVDFSVGHDAALRLTLNIRQYINVPTIGLLGPKESYINADNIFTKTFRKPFDVTVLAERIRRFVNRQQSVFS